MYPEGSAHLPSEHRGAQGPRSVIPHVGDRPQMRLSVAGLNCTPHPLMSDRLVHVYAGPPPARKRLPNIVASATVYAETSSPGASASAGLLPESRRGTCTPSP